MFAATPKIVIVTRPTRLDTLVRRWGTRSQAGFVRRSRKMMKAYVDGDVAGAAAAQRGEDDEFDALVDEDETYRAAVEALTTALDFGATVHVLDRGYVASYDFGGTTCVVVIGQDGLVANTAKYALGVPIVGVNPDPGRIDGVLLPFTVGSARAAVGSVLAGRPSVRPVTLARATLEDGQTMLAFNDLFIGAASHVSARYALTVGGATEVQSSSGLLVSTGAGSTGWLSSVWNMAAGVGRFLGRERPPAPPTLAWETRSLVWVVREPFVSATTGAGLVAGRLDEGQTLTVESRMPSGGVIFSDGIEGDFLDFTGGAIATIGLAPEAARLVVA